MRRRAVEPIELTVSHEAGCVLARTSGRIDEWAAGPFREQLYPLVGQSGTQVVLDLSQSNFISSHGIAQLVTLVAHANTNGSRVILAACSPFVSIVLERCKLNTFFEIAPSVADGIRMALEK